MITTLAIRPSLQRSYTANIPTPMPWQEEYAALLQAEAILDKCMMEISADEQKHGLSITPHRMMVYGASRYCHNAAKNLLRGEQ